VALASLALVALVIGHLLSSRGGALTPLILVAGAVCLLFASRACAQVQSPNGSEPKALTGSWEQVTEEAAFSPRDTAEDVVFGGKMWISNGYYHGGVLTRDLWHSTDGVTWTRVSEATPYDGYSEMVAYQGKMWAVKGSVWQSDDGLTWTRLLEETPFGARGYGELVVFKDRMWQLGSGNDVWHSSDGVNWTAATTTAPFGGRSASAVVVYKNKLWLMGGRITEANDPPEKGYPEYTTLNDVWCSEDGATWTRVLEHAPWVTRMWFISEVYAGKMWIVGGYSNADAKNLGDVWYSEDGVTWHEFVSDPVFLPRHEPTLYVYDGSLWVVAGNTWPVVNDAWRLTLPVSE
jgi:hypothetical protein